MLYPINPKNSKDTLLSIWRSAYSTAINIVEQQYNDTENPDLLETLQKVRGVIYDMNGILIKPFGNIDSVNTSRFGTWAKMAKLKEWQPADGNPGQPWIIYQVSMCDQACDRLVAAEEGNNGGKSLWDLRVPLELLQRSLRIITTKLTEMQANMVNPLNL